MTHRARANHSGRDRHPPEPAMSTSSSIGRGGNGDGSRWSYLSTSILRRGAAEFAARWHGCVRSDETILSKPPRQADGEHEWMLTGDTRWRMEMARDRSSHL